MGITQNITRRGVYGSRKVVEGNYAASGADTFELATGLKRCEMITLTPLGTAAAASGADVMVNETFPTGGNVTVLVASGATESSGIFCATGK